MKKKLNFIDRVKISVFNVKRYNELLKEGISKTIVYSILVSVIVGSILGGILFSTINTIENNIYNTVSKEDYQFSIRDGIFYFNKSPVKIEQGKNLIYINSDISINEVESIKNITVHKDYSISILKDGISIRLLDEEENYEYKNLPVTINIDNETILNVVDLLGIFKYLAFISSIITTYFMFMLDSFILSLIGLLMSKINNIRIKYIDLFKISVYATTLPIVISIFLPLGGLTIFISGIYLILIINNLRANRLM